MKKTISLFLALFLALCFSTAAAEEEGNAGKTFPDFTVTLTEVPPETAVRAFPVAEARTVYPENEGAKKVLFYAEGVSEPWVGYIVPDDTAHLRVEITAGDSPERMVFSYMPENTADVGAVADMLDQSRGVFACNRPMPAPSGGSRVAGAALYDRALGGQDPARLEIVLIAGEEYIEEAVAGFIERGIQIVRWELAKPVQEKEPLRAYILHVVDQYGDPVQGVYVNFCTDTACTIAQSDAAGTIRFDGAPDVYHVQLLKAPEGYRFDKGFEMYTGRDYGEWMIRVEKD